MVNSYGGEIMKKYCHNCGTENAGKGKFCIKCGTELLDTKDEGVKKVEPTVQDTGEYKTPAVQPQPIRKKQPPKISGPSNKTVLGVAVVAIILSVAAIFLGIFMKPATTVGAGDVGTNELANNSVTGGKVADGTLTDADISNIGISKIADNAITSNQIANNTIALQDLTSDVADSITGAANITNNSITTDKILNGTIITNDLADNSITSGKIKDGEVKSSDIATDAVGSDEIASGAVDTSELASDAVAYDDMKIKIRYGKATGLHNQTGGNRIAHNLGNPPDSVVVTPIYDSSFGSGNATIHANIISVDATYIYVTLYVEYEGNPGSLTPVTSGNTVDVYWIAID